MGAAFNRQRMGLRLTRREKLAFALGFIGLILQFAQAGAPLAMAAQVVQQPKPATNPQSPSAAGSPNSSSTALNQGAGGNTGGSAGSQSIAWNVGHLSNDRLRFPKNSTVDFLVTSGDKELQGVELAGSTLQDATSLLSLSASSLQLCVAGNCGGKFTVAPNTAQPVTLKVANNFDTPGVFAGEISLRVAGKAEPQSFRLTVYSRRDEDMAWGAATIAVGLALYFLVNVFLRRRIAVDEALVPAYSLRDSIGVLKTRVTDATARTQVPLPGLNTALGELEAQLSPAALSAHMPQVIVSPWSSSSTSWQDSLKTYLTPIADRTAAIVVLVNSGVQYAVSYWEKSHPAVTTALEKIDALAPTANNSASAQTQLATIIQILQAAVNPPKADALAPMLIGAPSAVIARFFTLPPDTQALQIRLVRNTLWVWWLVAVIALVGGFYAVVLANLGFGSPTDYIKCFFWGLGFSVAGTQLDQLTQTSVMSNSGITVPKA